MLEEQRVLLDEKHKQEDMDRLKRGLPQRWGTFKNTEAEDKQSLGKLQALVGFLQFISYFLSIYIE